MYKKKYMLILLSMLLVGLCAVSFVSASDANVTDDVSAVDSDVSDVAAIESSDDSDIDEVSAIDSDDEVESDDSLAVSSDEVSTIDDEKISAIDDEKLGIDNSADTLKKVEEKPLSVNGSSDVTKATIKLAQSGKAYKSAKLVVKVADSNGTALNKVPVKVKFSNKKSVTLTTNSKGIATYTMPFSPGTYKATASISKDNVDAKSKTLSNIKIVKAKLTIKAKKLTTTYKSGKYFQVKLVNSKNKAVKSVRVKMKVYTGKKYKTYSVKTNGKGIAKIKTNSLKRGKHKVVIKISSKNYAAKTKKTVVKITPKPVTVLARSGIYKYKGKQVGGVFESQVLNKDTRVPINGFKLKIKIYTGSKYQSFNLVTGKGEKFKGYLFYITNKPSVGTHKVVISSANKNFKGSVTTKLVIKKEFKQYKPYAIYMSNGKVYS